MRYVINQLLKIFRLVMQRDPLITRNLIAATKTKIFLFRLLLTLLMLPPLTFK